MPPKPLKGLGFSVSIGHAGWSVVTTSSGTASVTMDTTLVPRYASYVNPIAGVPDVAVSAPTFCEVVQAYVDAGNTLVGPTFSWEMTPAYAVKITCSGDTFYANGAGREDVLKMSGAPASATKTGSSAPMGWYAFQTDYQGGVYLPRIFPLPGGKGKGLVGMGGNATPIVHHPDYTRFFEIVWVHDADAIDRLHGLIHGSGISPQRVSVVYEDDSFDTFSVWKVSSKPLDRAGQISEIRLTLGDWR